MEPVSVDYGILGQVARGEYALPHDVLGPHLHGDGGKLTTVRVLRPNAQSVKLRFKDGDVEMTHEVDGIWFAVFASKVDASGAPTAPDYRILTNLEGEVFELDDPYRFLPSLGEIDQHLIGEGRHEELWNVLGANVQEYYSELGEVRGVSFAVWAPNATAVQVRGDFNFWNGQAHQMRSLGACGVWELFIPGAKSGQNYKFQVRTSDGAWLEKADPVAKFAELPPATSSTVFDSSYSWEDAAWLKSRADHSQHTSAMSVYEVHVGSWRQGKSYRDLATELVEYVSDLGFTHVEFMPIAQHPFAPSWGYQVTGYYAPNSQFGNPDDFRFLVDKLHQAGIGVIVDWVPAHFPKDAWALARFDGTALYEDPNPLRGEHPDWGTLIFNFGRAEVKNFLVANACYWMQEFHVDGLRVDAVASMLYLDYSREDGQWAPNQYGGRENLEAISFLQEVNATVYKRYPGVVMIAEESTSFTGVTAPTSSNGLGFGFKWNMGWMNDTLRYVEDDPVYRSYHHGELTFSMVYAYSENFILPLSHDEVVHGKGSLIAKMPGDLWQQLANLRALYAYQWAHPGKQLTFMGSEFAQWHEWAGADSSLDWNTLMNPGHRGISDLVRDLNALMKRKSALYELDNTYEGFEWIDSGDNQKSLLSFIRKNSAGSTVVVVVNFSNAVYEDFRIALPKSGRWSECLNTDDLKYGGSGVTNPGLTASVAEEFVARAKAGVSDDNAGGVVASEGFSTNTTGSLNAVEGDIFADAISWTGREYSSHLRVPPLGAVFLEHFGY